MAENPKIYGILFECADSFEKRKEKIEKYKGFIAVYEDNFALGFIVANNDVSFNLYGTFVENDGMVLYSRNFIYNFNSEERYQTFPNSNDPENWHGDIFRSKDGKIVCYDKAVKTKIVPITENELFNDIYQTINNVYDYIQKNSPDIWTSVTDTANGLRNIENKAYISRMKPTYESKEIPEIFKQSQPGEN